MKTKKKQENTIDKTLGIVKVLLIIAVCVAICWLCWLGITEAKAETASQFESGLYIVLQQNTLWQFIDTTTLPTQVEPNIDIAIVWNNTTMQINKFRPVPQGQTTGIIYPYVVYTNPASTAFVTTQVIYIAIDSTTGLTEGQAVQVQLSYTNGTTLQRFRYTAQVEVQKRANQTDVTNAYSQGYNEGYTEATTEQSTFWGYFVGLGDAVSNVILSFFQWEFLGVNIAELVGGILTVAIMWVVVKMLL